LVISLKTWYIFCQYFCCCNIKTLLVSFFWRLLLYLLFIFLKIRLIDKVCCRDQRKIFNNFIVKSKGKYNLQGLISEIFPLILRNNFNECVLTWKILAYKDTESIFNIFWLPINFYLTFCIVSIDLKHQGNHTCSNRVFIACRNIRY
jgi:hypothetical protein